MRPDRRSRFAATGIVLAGGRSSRMGRPKAVLPLGGGPMVALVVRALREVVDDIVVVGAPGQDLPAIPARLIEDEVAHQGPMSGILRGLDAARSELCVVAPCDAAFLVPAVLSHLLARAHGHDIVVPRWQGRLQPLHAVYRRRVRPVLAGLLAEGERRPISAFDRVRTLTVEEDAIRRLDPEGRSFWNINTPDDYWAALELWAAWCRVAESALTE